MDPLSLFSSLVWGSIGLAYVIYGKNRKRPVPLTGGIVLMAVSYFLKPLTLSIAGVVMMAAIYYLGKRM